MPPLTLGRSCAVSGAAASTAAASARERRKRDMLIRRRSFERSAPPYVARELPYEQGRIRERIKMSGARGGKPRRFDRTFFTSLLIAQWTGFRVLLWSRSSIAGNDIIVRPSRHCTNFRANRCLRRGHALTEAMCLLGKSGGHPYQAALWPLRSDGRLLLHDLTAVEIDRAELLMEKYGNFPGDLADASLVALAESLSHQRVFTLDRRFHIYRLADRSVLESIPGLPG